MSQRFCAIRAAPCARVAMQIVAAPVLPSFAFNKHAFPNRRLVVPAGPNHSTRRNKARFLCVISEAQYQAFVRFAVASSAASQPSRSIGPACWNLSPGRALLREFWPPAVKRRGEPTLNRCCDRKVVSPRGYSKRFFRADPAYPMGFCPQTARRIPDKSALAGPCSASPAAAISAATSSLWSCPTSTTSQPPGTSRSAARGAMIR